MLFAGFGFAILLSYKSLQTLTNSSEQLSSRVVTVSVSNPNTTNLSEPIILTFNHLKVTIVFLKRLTDSYSDSSLLSLIFDFPRL